MKLPYKDSRGEFALVFTACDHMYPFDSSTLDVGVTFRPQHAKYAQNVIENLAMHLKYRCHCPDQYMAKMLKGAHVLMMRGKKWHREHEKAYDPKHMQEGLSAKDLSYVMEEFNLDISVVLKDAAMAVSRTAVPETATEADGVSIPRAASNASQQLSMLNSITTFRDVDEELEDTRPTPTPTQRTLPRNPWASPLVPAANPISIQSPSTAVTITTIASADSSNMQTTPHLEDSSLTTATESAGMTEAQVKNLLATYELQWQAKMSQEVERRLAEQREEYLKQDRARNEHNSNVQTAHSSGGGPSP
jgi:hypothetical protein